MTNQEKVQKVFLTIFSILLAFLCASCSGGTHTSDNRDSIPADVANNEKTAIAELPDTAYQSAKSVNFRVEIADTTISGKINSLEDLYTDAPGAFTFRCGSRRDADFGGTLPSKPSEISVDWSFTTDEDYTPTKYGTWGGGTGWTGQPLYVNWPDSCMSNFTKLGISNAKEEIMVGSLSGRVYFIDFATGKTSRQAINTGNPIKGTISLDPTLNGNLYVGQGLSAHKPVGALVIDLYKHDITHFFGADPKAQRRWEAYDSSPVRVGQFLFRPGENGTLYKYIIETGSLKFHSALRYTCAGSAPGMEASMSVYRNYGYTADNHGNILCINLNTLQPVWHYKLPDDTDSTPIVAEEEDGVFIYTGCEVEHAGVTEAAFVKLDALTGKEEWINRTPARRANIGEKHFDGGFYATALLGRGNCSHLIFANAVNNTDGQNGSFMAINRKTGKTVYTTPLRYYAWSSPVGFLDKDGQQYVFTGDCSGNAYIINGIDGKIIVRKSIGNNFESSPVVIGNQLVIGSRGNTIFKMSIK